MAFVHAYNNDTGEWVDVPEAWLGHPHPQFRKFSMTSPSDELSGEKNPAPEPVTKKTAAKGGTDTESGD